MPGMDGTGPTGCGPMTGGRRGRCVGVADAAPAGRGMGCGRGMGQGRGGRGYRNQYYATGLTGWQRAQMDTAADGPQAPRDDRVEQLEQRLDEALARLARLEGTE
jgi:hypothetical protein